MRSTAANIGKVLRARKKTLATAESCTGGYLSHLITSVAGSSDYFIGGVIAYDNKIKVKELGVKSSTLKKYGAVSAECATEMAAGLRKKFKADVAVATTGIAGPTGGVPGKPVGTAFIALAYGKQVRVERVLLKGNRVKVIGLTAQKALRMLASSL